VIASSKRGRVAAGDEDKDYQWVYAVNRLLTCICREIDDCLYEPHR
jgi:hypothetical protein